MIGQPHIGRDKMAFNNLRKSEDFDNLHTVIAEKGRGKKIFDAPNKGNWGDGLIHAGTVQFLNDKKIPFKQVGRPTFQAIQTAIEPTGMRLEGAILLAGGGGSWSKNYGGSRAFLTQCATLFDHVIVLPATYELPPLDLPSDRITYFRRDKFNSRETNPASNFCHDMAFYLNHDLVSSCPLIDVGNFFRDDKEKNQNSSLPPGNLDISMFGTEGKGTKPFFQLLTNYKSARTDRMHVAIACCLLGIECELFPGNYFKSSAVFKSSIETNFKTCRLGDWKGTHK